MRRGPRSEEGIVFALQDGLNVTRGPTLGRQDTVRPRSRVEALHSGSQIRSALCTRARNPLDSERIQARRLGSILHSRTAYSIGRHPPQEGAANKNGVNTVARMSEQASPHPYVRITKYAAKRLVRPQGVSGASYFHTAVHSLPVDYWIEGWLLISPAPSARVTVLRTNRNGNRTLGVFITTTVSAVNGDYFTTENSVYRLESLPVPNVATEE